MFEAAGVLHRQQNQLLEAKGNGLISIAATSVLEYPSHPFTADLQDRISHFPRGIAVLALDCRLSLQLLDFLQVFLDWHGASSLTSDPRASMIELGCEILCIEGLTFIERLLVIAVQSYIAWLDRTISKSSNSWTEYEFERHLKALKESEASIETLTGDRRDTTFIWCCLMLRDTTRKGSASRRWAEAQLMKLCIHRNTEEELDRLFFARPRTKESNEEDLSMRMCPYYY